MPFPSNLPELTVATGARDPLAFRRLFEATAGRFKAVAFRLVGREDEAEQVLLDSYERIWRQASTYRRDEQVAGAWLLHLLRMTALDRPREALGTPPGQPIHGDEPIWSDLAGLGDERRSLLRAYRDGWSYGRLAAESGTTPDAARDLVLRALWGLGAGDEDELLVAEAVVGALGRTARQEMERRCGLDPRLAAAHAHWSAHLAPLALAVDDMAPSADLWPRIIAVTGAVAEIPVPRTVLNPGRLPLIRRGRSGERRWLYLTDAGATVLLGLVIYAVTGGSSLSEIEAADGPWQAAPPALRTTGPSKPAD